MNIMINNTKCVTNLLNNISKNHNCMVRGIKIKSDLPKYINWRKPVKVLRSHPSRSGDLGLKTHTDPTGIPERFAKILQGENVDENVKKLLSYDYLPVHERYKNQKKQIVELVKRHKLDTKSIEYKIADMTCGILYLQPLNEAQPYEGKLKSKLLELVAKRKKALRYLRRWDYRRFEWILEKLNLIYKPDPELDLRVERKRSMRDLTKAHCDEIIQKKLDAYKAELESQKKDFYKEKAEKLAFVRQEELACGVAPTVTEEDIVEATQMFERLQSAEVRQ